ncbi:MBL fold metallo-hydrolase [Leucobacter albus]|uniref:MBL fold metallo-hydrolase n=1 Tax=Leucobacter albus TaxID=272210 RepID=A0ABW3TSC8_9MICO
MDPVRPTSDSQWAALRAGELPAVEEVRPGVYAIALNMPGMQPPYAFSYAFIAGGGSRAVHLIDAGLDTDENWELLASALAGLGRRVEDIATVTITHLHFDHTGLANRIREAAGARVRMHVDEAAAIRAGLQFSAGLDVGDQLAEWGVPEGVRAELYEVATSRADFGSAVIVDDELADGDLIDLGEHRARVIHTPGHTTGHVCLALDGEAAVFTGDHVLPVINPGIALGGRRAADPLGEYYASLDRLAPHATDEALPGHGFRFASLGSRCAEIRAHHEARTEQAAALLAATPDLTVWELASGLTWTGGWGALPIVSRVSALAQTDMHRARVLATAHGLR